VFCHNWGSKSWLTAAQLQSGQNTINEAKPLCFTHVKNCQFHKWTSFLFSSVKNKWANRRLHYFVCLVLTSVVFFNWLDVQQLQWHLPLSSWTEAKCLEKLWKLFCANCVTRTIPSNPICHFRSRDLSRPIRNKQNFQSWAFFNLAPNNEGRDGLGWATNLGSGKAHLRVCSTLQFLLEQAEALQWHRELKLNRKLNDSSCS